MGDGMLSLSWNNHSTTFCHMLSALRLKERYTDATVACEGKFYPVHKLVLSTCSQYFEEMFEHTAGKHPVVLLQDVRRDELEALLSYMYAGIVSVAQRDLSRLIKVAELLQIKGLAVPDEIPSEKRSKGNSNHSSSSEKVSSKSHACEPSDDRSSPHPKRRRREESSEEPQTRPDSPCTYNSASQECFKNEYHSQEPGGEEATHRLEEASSDACDGEVSEEQKRVHSEKAVQQRMENQNVERYQTQDSSRSQYKDGGEETIEIKEETWEETGEQPSTNNLSGDMEYCGGMPADTPAEGPQEDHGRLIVPAKYEGQSHQGQQLPPQALPEVVVEALAGPSGMHEWLGGSEFGGGLATSDSYSGEGSPPHHPVAGVEGDSQREGGGGTSERSGAPREVHQCPCCSYITPRKDHMKEHIRTHTGEKPFSCPHCPYRTAKNSDIHRHIQTHTGEKPFACSQCSFRTSRRVNLKNHLRTHSDGTGSKEFACPTCDYRCSRQWALTRHLQTHIHTCPYCQLCFPRKSQLTVHLQSHVQ